MSRYNSNWGSHDQLQELRKANIMMDRTISELKKELEEIKDELELAREALRREMLENTSGQIRKWRGLATMMSHFDICTSARISCNICAEARQAYVEALTNG